MRLGLIARADNSGLGVQTWEFHRAMQPDHTLVIDVGHMHDRAGHCNKRTFRDRYPNAVFHQGWIPPEHLVRDFLHGLDAVFTCETGYHPHFFDIARQMGVRTVLQPNFEFLDRNDSPDVWAAPSLWRYDEIPTPKQYLPVPIATDRFNNSDCSTIMNSEFLHVVGRPAVHDRNGTLDLLRALTYVRSEIKVTIRCQDDGYVGGLIAQHNLRTPNNVTLVLESADVDNYWDMYTGGTLIMPRRFGGLCLPVNEALGAGMPVIMPDISPNNCWLPSQWLVPAAQKTEFTAKQTVTVSGCNVQALASKIEQFADADFYRRARHEADILARGLSWDVMKPEYEKVLAG